eukprot:jgi/Chlat1/7771/Chrsp66S07235
MLTFQGVNLAASVASGQLAVIDCLTQPAAWLIKQDFESLTPLQETSTGRRIERFTADEEAAEPLRPLYQLIQQWVRTDEGSHTSAPRCIIVDSVSTLLWLAGPYAHALDFIRCCRALNTALVLCIQSDAVEVVAFVNAVKHLSDLVIEVEPLESGYAHDVHGQLTVTHQTDALLAKRDDLPSNTSSIIQYRLADGGYHFFRPGGPHV